MNKKLILVAPNSYKECANSVKAANVIETSLHKYLNENKSTEYEFTKKPISDGGDGFLEVCDFYFGTKEISMEISLPWGKGKFKCSVAYSEKNKSVFIESAKVLGLALIPPGKRQPLRLNSKGLGELLFSLNELKNSGEIKFDKIVIGIGGTGTSDLGIGACSAFGMKLINKEGDVLSPFPENFNGIHQIIWEKPEFDFVIKTIIDVENPLLGPNGANYVFAKQKGASDSEMQILENGFKNILAKTGAQADTVLSGAGGGLSAGLKLFFGAEEIYAEDFIKNELGINNKNLSPQILITGEGKFDVQTYMNKGAAIVINEFKNSGCEIFVIAGSSENKSEDFHIIELIEFFENEEESIKQFEKGIDFACKKIAESYFLES